MKKIAFILLVPLCFMSCAPKSYLVVKPVILRQIPHDRGAFTQGLLLNDSILYESTGLVGKSTLRALSAQNGEMISQKRLPKEYFGEGLALLDDNLYQLTLKSGDVRVYALPQMDFLKTVSHSGAGWGLTTVGDNFVMSNGTNILSVMTKEFELIRKIAIRHQNKDIQRLNELEYANGKIYANIWQTNHIYEIDYPTGEVTKIIDCTDITQSLSGLKKGEILNGIAYNPSGDSFYITGKNWPRYFEVKFP